MRIRSTIFGGGLALLVWLGSSNAWITHASAQPAPYFRGKTIRIVVGTSTGGFNDFWGRLLAHHLPRHIDGNPNVIVQKMAGAGSVIAANYIYTVTKPDGLVLGMPLNTIYMDQLVGRKEVKFDVRKFVWIGTQEKNDLVLYMRADAPYKSIAEILQAQDAPKCGATGTTGKDYILARLLEETLGVKINTVIGYKGGSETDLAVERGEVVCRGMDISAHFARSPYLEWHNKGFDRHIVQTGRKRDHRLPDTPTIYELMEEHKTPEISRRVAQIILSNGEFGRPMIAAPGTPLEVVKILRAAYASVLKDPQLLAEAKKSKADVDYTSGEELQALTVQLMEQPPAVIERMKKLLGAGQ
jgi:tripartite-type tricarboxylate transporter receptor subunit TctC